MFGLMKVSTHEGIAKELRLRLQAEKDSLGRVIERKNRSETRVAQLTIEKADVEERLRHAEAELATFKPADKKMSDRPRTIFQQSGGQVVEALKTQTKAIKSAAKKAVK